MMVAMRGLLAVLLAGCLSTPARPDDQVVNSTPGTFALGGLFACELSQGALYCWGDNHYGQLGDPNAGVVVTTPARIGTLSSWTLIGAGGDHACGVHDGMVECWGRNDFGQTTGAPGGVRVQPTPLQLPAGVPVFESIAGASFRTCAIGQHQLWCWGQQDGTHTTSIPPTQFDPAVSWTDVEGGGDHSCAIGDGNVYCWGTNGVGESGQPTATKNLATPTQVPFLPSDRVALHVATGDQWSCAIMAKSGAKTGQLYCWGGPVDPMSTPQVESSEGWSSVELAGINACGVRDGRAVCWGGQSHGTLGTGQWYGGVKLEDAMGFANADRVVMPRIGSGTDEISCLVDQGQLKCWGDPLFGEFGNGHRTVSGSAVTVPAPSGHTWTGVWAGDFHTCATTEDKTLYCWGDDGPGTIKGLSGCGDQSRCQSASDQPTQPRPIQAPSSIGKVEEVVANGGYTCARLAGGSPSAVWCWGGYSGVYLGSAAPVPPTPRALPKSYSTIFGGHEATCGLATGLECWGRIAGAIIATPTTFTTPLTQLSSNESFACGLSAAGDRFCWGDNTLGQLGTGTTGGSTTMPPATAQESGVTAITTGDTHACELKSGGVYCWGFNDYNQVAPTGGPSFASPTQIMVGGSPLSGCQQLAATMRHTCALCGGQVYCWGADENDSLGRDPDNPPADPFGPAPPALPTGRQWTKIAVGGWHGCALDNTGELDCWGRSALGQLGDGSTDLLFPTPLPTLP